MSDMIGELRARADIAEAGERLVDARTMQAAAAEILRLRYRIQHIAENRGDETAVTYALDASDEQIDMMIKHELDILEDSDDGFW